MKTRKLFIAFVGFFFLTSVTLDGVEDAKDAFDAAVNTLKQECKDLIKPARYEGSKVTYLNVTTSKQKKSVEVFMFLTNEYTFAIGGKKISAPLTVKIYDAADGVDERTLIKEFKNVQGTNFTFSSSELNKIYRKKVPEVERLKNIHLEYSIGSGKTAKEAIVLVYGSKG